MNFTTNNKMPARKKPKIGDNKSALPMEVAWVQSTPDVPLRPCNSAFIMPTPMIEPMSVCELDAGRPKNQVLTFQMMAAISKANTMAKPALLPTWRINSTGRSETMPKATAPDDHSTPARLNIPDHTTAKFAGSEWV